MCCGSCARVRSKQAIGGGAREGTGGDGGAGLRSWGHCYLRRSSGGGSGHEGEEERRVEAY